MWMDEILCEIGMELNEYKNVMWIMKLMTQIIMVV